MRSRLGALALALLSACQRESAPDRSPQAGERLERAAIELGMVSRGAASPVGVFAAEGDRACLLPDGGSDRYRLGASVDYGEGQNCVARGIARGGETLTIDFGGGCRFDGRITRDDLRFPAVLPEACARYCAGRASLSAMHVERLSETPAEAERLRGADGRLLCAY